MPTPSSSHTANESHNFASSCPDDQGPHSPSSWQPLPPYPVMESVRVIRIPGTLDDGDSASRSTTLSPRLTSQDGDDVEAAEPPGHPQADLDDPNKQSDSDEEIRTADRPGGEAVSGINGLTEAQVIERQIYSPSARRRRSRYSSAEATSSSANPGGLDDTEAMEVDGYVDELGSSMGYEYSNLRLIPTSPSSFLRPGSQFTGTQQSERQVYDVHVEIKHVDFRESFLCGYLRIQGLTDDHPTLTTYFEGEIIGTKYSFMTKHDNWGANDRIDLSHWSKFAAFRPFAKQAKKGNAVIKDVAQREHIFMRWKEHFLVPDHRVRTINGASFEGFYYICFNQIQGEVSGIYFHSKSEKFQQLELKHVEDRGCYSAIEFR